MNVDKYMAVTDVHVEYMAHDMLACMVYDMFEYIVHDMLECMIHDIQG